MSTSMLLHKLKAKTPNRFYSYISKVIAPSRKLMYLETRKTFGDKNTNLKVYVIRRQPPGAGLFSNVNHVLRGIIYAEKNHMIPVVDMKNYPVEYSQFLPYNNSKNAWEYFFRPISHITLNEAYKSANVILSDGNRIITEPSFSGRRLDFILDTKKLKKFSTVFNKYIKLNSFMSEYLDYIIAARQIDINSTLGVFFRSGTDIQNALGHPKQPNLDYIISEINNYLSSHDIGQIVLSLDDEENRKVLQKKFGNIVCEDFRLDLMSDFAKTTKTIFQIPKGPLLKNVSYLSEIYILARLRYNISSLSNGSVGIYLINDGMFEKNSIYFKGVQN
jgi:hypothetical protein